MPKLDARFKILKEKNGSDLHFSPGNPPLMRAASEMVPAATPKITHEENKLLLYEVMTEQQRNQRFILPIEG